MKKPGAGPEWKGGLDKNQLVGRPTQGTFSGKETSRQGIEGLDTL